MNVLTWIIFGLIVGLSAHYLDVQTAKGGLVSTVILGILGALLGGFLGDLIFGAGVTDFNLSSFIVAAIGSLVVLFASRAFISQKQV